MPTCPKCQMVLTNAEVLSGVCPVCNFRLPTDDIVQARLVTTVVQRSNAMAIIGLIAGIGAALAFFPSTWQKLSFGSWASLWNLLPLVLAPLALFAGLAGLVATLRKGEVEWRGRGAAIWGMSLGTIVLVLWCGVTYIAYSRYARSYAARAHAEGFLIDLIDGDVDDAEAACADGMGKSKIHQLSATMEKWGRLLGVQWTRIELYDGEDQVIIGGMANFEIGRRRFELRMRREFGDYKIDAWQFEN